MDRLYLQRIKKHLKKYRQMVFIAGPRQVGKTTLVKKLLKESSEGIYLNWDIPEDRKKILSFYENSSAFLNLDIAKKERPIVALDEIHKFKDWKNFLKGFYDLYGEDASIIVTGSAKLNVYKKGGDSLMGRYFLYRMYPFSISEIQGRIEGEELIKSPALFAQSKLERLLTFGGFPDPYLKNDKEFFKQWQKLRLDQFFKEEIRDLSRVYDIAQMEILAMMLTEQAGQLLNYTALSKKIRVSVNTVREWIHLLEQLYFCFRVRPWYKNVARSLIKEPKVYLWDWSNAKDKGAKVENMVACHLLKAAHYWSDIGLGEYELFFLRDKEKREIDFLVTKDNSPWLLIEAKSSVKDSLNSNLGIFQSQVNASHVFQVAYDLGLCRYRFS